MRISGLWKRKNLIAAAILLLAIAAIFAAQCALTGVKPGSYTYPSYLLQAQAWLRGDLALDRNYEYLELAVYEGRYYVSFPPVPSIPMVLWTLIWGNDVPGGLFQKIYIAITAIAVFSALRCRERVRTADCVAWSLFICLGSSMLPIALKGAVWYEAQIMAFTFSVSAIAAMVRGRPTLSCLLYALSVGCRPFSVLLGPVLLALYLRRESGRDLRGKIVRLIPGLAVGLCVAAGYAAFNYVRFGSIFEFGHNYLPEFTRAEHGQFSLTYIANNWRTLFFGRPFTTDGATITFNQFGFSMFLSNPILICLLVWAASDIARRQFTRQKLLILLMCALNVFFLLMHRTLGGYQFGLRYALELVPLCLAYLLFSPERTRLTRWECAVMCFGLAFNFLGGCLVHI